MRTYGPWRDRGIFQRANSRSYSGAVNPHPYRRAISKEIKMELQRIREFAARSYRLLRHRRVLVLPAALLLAATGACAQSDPWDNAVQVLQTAFTGPIARGLALV